MKNQSDSNSDEKSDNKPTDDYSKYVIVAEKEFITTSTEVAFHNALWKFAANYNCAGTPSRSHSTSSSSSRSRSHSPRKSELDISVSCNYIFPTNSDCHAEILFIDGKDETVTKREIFKMGTTTPSYDANSTSVVIRILEEKQKFVEKLTVQCVPDVTFVVNGEKCEANRQYLALESPVFEKMLFGKFMEAKQFQIKLEDIGSADDFKDFLLAVSPLRVQPNPTNVLSLLKLAHQYDFSSLMRMCEEHLKFCYEIPIIDRMFLAAKYDLKSLIVHTTHVMTDQCCYDMWQEYKEKLMQPEFLYLLDMIMERLNMDRRIKKMKNQSGSNSDSKSTNDYSKYVIVAENEFNTPAATYLSTEVTLHHAHWKIFVRRSRSQFRQRSPPRLHSRSRSHSPRKPDLDTRVCCNYIFPTNTDCHAEILFNDGKDEPLKKREIFKAGTTTPSYDANSTSVVIRILEEKKKFEEKLSVQCVPDVTFIVNDVKYEANRQYLALESPKFKEMLLVKFKDQAEIVLEDVESADYFKDFLLAVSPCRIQPNPTNVLALLELARQYDVSSLMRMCEEHLKFCYEISIVDRIFIAEEYNLKSLKVFLKSSHAMTNERCYKMWKEHKAKLLKPEFSYLLDMVMDRVIAHVKTNEYLTKIWIEHKESLLNLENSDLLDMFMDCLK